MRKIRFITEMIKFRTSRILLGRLDFFAFQKLTWPEVNWDEPDERFKIVLKFIFI